MSRRKISHAWMIVVAFFTGGAISSIAQDPSDTLFFAASAKGALTPIQQTLYWYWVPFAIYVGFAIFGYLLAKFTRVNPAFLLYLYAFIVILSTYFSLQLPQSSTQIYTGSVLLGTAVSLGIILGLRREIRSR